MIGNFIFDQAVSSRNKACRANVTATHTAGTKSFARIIEEEVIKILLLCFHYHQ